MINKMLKITCVFLMTCAVLPAIANDEFTEENLQSSIAQIRENFNKKELEKIILSQTPNSYLKKKVYQATDLLYIKQLGGGDENWVSYTNNYIRFVKGENGTKSYWFYVYDKEEYNEKFGFSYDTYEELPKRLIVKVYEGNLQEELSSKYNLQESDMTVVDKYGVFSPFYFQAGDMDFVVFTYWKHNYTAILSGPSGSGELLSNLITRDYDNSFPENDYGENDEELNEMAKSTAIL